MFFSARKFHTLLCSHAQVMVQEDRAFGIVEDLIPTPVRKGPLVFIPEFNDGQLSWGPYYAVALFGLVVARNHYRKWRLFVNKQSAANFLTTV